MVGRVLRPGEKLTFTEEDRPGAKGRDWLPPQEVRDADGVTRLIGRRWELTLLRIEGEGRAIFAAKWTHTTIHPLTGSRLVEHLAGVRGHYTGDRFSREWVRDSVDPEIRVQRDERLLSTKDFGRLLAEMQE